MDTKEYLLRTYGATMTPEQVARELHKSGTHVRALCENGEIPAARIGKRWFVQTIAFADLICGNVG